ncbi:MAG: sodium:calcium antiporter [bacterium]|nr:sodium:calcium antiporter [bacterium]MXZ31770.1 sodium:calcium antiporter [Acidimicrobiia bacterium]
MAADVVVALVGLALLLAGSHWLVAGSSRLAARRGMSPVVVGAVILGFGTSMPELVVGVTAAAQGDPALGLGGIVGSNAANMGLVLGVAALASPIAADRSAWWRVPASLVAVGLFGGLLLTGGTLQRWEGGVLLAAMVGATWWLLRDPGVAGGKGSAGEPPPLDDGSPSALDRWLDGAVRRLAPRSRGEMWRMTLGLAGIVVGAQVSVDGFTGIAARLGIATGLVGLSLVAVGTSLPELATALVGIRRGQPLLTLGNLLGSNIFNSLAVGGIVVMVRPGGIGSEGTPWVAAGAMIGLMLLAVALLATRRSRPGLERWEGAVLLGGYAAALPFILMS